jgi:predicted RNase H-like HicB family nuclease
MPSKVYISKSPEQNLLTNFRVGEGQVVTMGTFYEGIKCGEIELGKRQVVSPAENWSELIPHLIKAFSEKTHEALRIAAIEKRMLTLEKRITSLEREQSVIVPIDSLKPEPYNVLRTIHAVVSSCEGNYIASFVDANINSSGETLEEAIHNIKDMIVITYESLKQEDKKRLGPDSLRQMMILDQFIQKID